MISVILIISLFSRLPSRAHKIQCKLLIFFGEQTFYASISCPLVQVFLLNIILLLITLLT